jgi:serine/threonine-protein kinase
MRNITAVRFGIKLKLFTLVLIAISFVIGVILWQIDSQSKQSAQTTVIDSLKQSQIILNTKLESRFNDIEETAISMSRDGRVLPLVYDQDSLTLQDLSLEFEKALAFQSMFITDAEGYILARSDRPEAIGHSLAGRSTLFDDPLQGKVSTGFISSGGQILQIVTVPVFDNVVKDIVRGTISLSYALSPAIAKEINALTQSEVSFYIFTYDEKRNINGVESFYSTMPKFTKHFLKKFNQETEWNRFQNLDHDDNDETFTFEKETLRAVIKPIPRNEGENLGFIVAHRSETELLKPFQDIERSVFIVGLVCLGFALIAAWVLATRISKPIINLVELTNDINNGKYPEDKGNKRSDEVGVLHQALLKMGKGLKDKNELENYLAEIASDIGVDVGKDLFEETNRQFIDDTEALDATLVDSQSQQEANSEIDATVVMDSRASNSHSGSQVTSSKLIAGRYRVIKLLGKGTTGEAYLAHDEELDEQIAIKILLQEYVSGDFATMFKEEIKLARQITHRNILRTFDFGSADGIFYITMEYIQGYDLSELLAIKGALTPHIAVIMTRQICSALAAAHELGIIHRDLKPANMIINQQGVLKIMDFGLAMKVSSKAKTHDSDGNEISDQETTIAGTPRFMAPEQFTAIGLDQRTDIYAVGIILFTLLTGKPPFNASGFQSLANQHTYEDAPLLGSVMQNAPKELEIIIKRALMKKQDDRFQSVSDMLNELNDAEY